LYDKHVKVHITQLYYCFRMSTQPRAGVTIKRTRRLPRALGQRTNKYDYVLQKVTNVHQEKIVGMMKVNETHVYAV